MKLLARPQLVILVTLVAVAALLPFAGCDKATPVAPSGTTLAISASPSTVGLTGTSTVTVIGRRPNGSPLIPGTEIQFSTNLGSITPTLTTTNSAGEATATFRADGRPGSATITASSNSSSAPTPSPTPAPTPTTGALTLVTGEASVSVTTTILVGESPATKPMLLLSVNPDTVPINGTSTVTVIARNSDGSPVAAGREVILTTTLGTLSPSRPTTRSDGTATSTLRIGAQSGTATVTAILGSSDAATAKVEVKDAILTLTATPSSVAETGGDIELKAFLSDFAGNALPNRTVQFRSERGTVLPSSAQTDSDGFARANLHVDPENLTTNITFQATATTPSGSGQILSESVTITIRANP